MYGQNSIIIIISTNFRYGNYYESDTSLFCPIPERKALYFNIVLPFSPILWIVFGIFVMAVTIILAILLKLDQKLLNKNAKKSTYSAFFDVIGILSAEYNAR